MTNNDLDKIISHINSQTREELEKDWEELNMYNVGVDISEIISRIKSSNEYHIGYRTAVDKACDWLKDNLPDQDPAHYNYDMEKMYAEFIEDFKEAMED